MFPYLLHIGHLYLPTYGALAALGLLLALTLSLRTSVLAGVSQDALWDAGLFAVLAAYLLSRLLLVVAYARNFLAFPWLLLAVPSLTWPGLILTAAATWLWLRRKRVPVLRALDAWAPCALLVWTLLALGEFAEGSDPGLPSGRSFGVALPGEAIRLYPTALYAALLAAVLSVLTYACLRSHRPQGETAALALIAGGGTDYVLSFFRQPGEIFWFGLEPRQWTCIVLIACGGMILALTRKPHAPHKGDAWGADLRSS